GSSPRSPRCSCRSCCSGTAPATTTRRAARARPRARPEPSTATFAPPGGVRRPSPPQTPTAGSLPGEILLSAVRGAGRTGGGPSWADGARHVTRAAGPRVWSLDRDDDALLLLGEEVGHLVGREQLVEGLDARVLGELRRRREHVVVLAVALLGEDHLVLAQPGQQRERGGDDGGVLVVDRLREGGVLDLDEVDVPRVRG